MVVSGLPIRNGDQHVIEIAKMSQAILNEVKSFKVQHLPERQLKIRIGFHSGMSKHPQFTFSNVSYAICHAKKCMYV